MKKINRRALLLVVGLILVTGVAMGITGHEPSGATIDMVGNANDTLAVNAHRRAERRPSHVRISNRGARRLGLSAPSVGATPLDKEMGHCRRGMPCREH